jgi:hypothetical protein
MSSLASTRSIADACDLCGAVAADGDTMHFALGKLWCAECWAGQRPAVAMPPNANERRQLELWLAPQPSRGAP